MAKVPGGGSRLASYAAALYLIKENYSISEKKLLKDLQEAGIDPTDLLAEENNWFVHENNDLAKGLYKLKFEKIAHPIDIPIKPGDTVRVEEDIQPCGEMFGIHIYEATHVRSKQTVYVTSMELLR